MSLSRGTWVEIIMDGEHHAKRFSIGDSHITPALFDDKGNVIDRDVMVYHAPFDFSLPGMPQMISCFREEDLRIINKDGERLSELSFNALVDALKNGTLSQINEGDDHHNDKNMVPPSSHRTGMLNRINLDNIKPASPEQVSFRFGPNVPVRLDFLLKK